VRFGNLCRSQPPINICVEGFGELLDREQEGMLSRFGRHYRAESGDVGVL